MVRVLVWRVVNRGFEPQSGKTKDCKICIFCVSAKHATLRTKTGCLGIRIICPSGATCLSTDSCFSELTL